MSPELTGFLMVLGAGLSTGGEAKFVLELGGSGGDHVPFVMLTCRAFGLLLLPKNNAGQVAVWRGERGQLGRSSCLQRCCIVWSGPTFFCFEIV